MPFTVIDRELLAFEQALSIVMSELESNMLNILGDATTVQKVFDANVLLNSQPAMLEALRDAGYFSLAEKHVATFALIPPAVKAEYAAAGLPLVEFTTLDKADMTALAKMDLDEFNNIGVSAMNELRLTLVRNAVSSTTPLSEMVSAIAAATVGVDGKGSPLSNHASAHADTAINTFNGEVNIKAAESFGHDKPTDRWRVFGPNDSKTRDVCEAALSKPVRTREEWEASSYWGGSPGGWRCRHRFRPVRDKDES